MVLEDISSQQNRCTEIQNTIEILKVSSSPFFFFSVILLQPLQIKKMLVS